MNERQVFTAKVGVVLYELSREAAEEKLRELRYEAWRREVSDFRIWLDGEPVDPVPDQVYGKAP